MARMHASRRQFSQAVHRARTNFDAVHALILIGSFVIGALLEWVRSLPFSAHWGWRLDMFSILVAAWLSLALLVKWPHHNDRNMTRVTGLLLLVLFIGSLIMHELINH